jgi:hypothetical protein
MALSYQTLYLPSLFVSGLSFFPSLFFYALPYCTKQNVVSHVP